MQLLMDLAWSGNIPGYGDAVQLGACVSRPNTRELVFANGQTVALPEIANWVSVSDGGKWAWQGHESGLVYEGLVSTGKKGYGQNSFLYVGETLRIFTDVATYQSTAGGWRYVDEAGNLVSYGATYSGNAAQGIPWARTVFADGLMIGQGPNDGDGVVVSFPATPASPRVFQQLCPGNVQNIRAHRYGDQFVITAVDYSQHRTRVYSASLADLRALPLLKMSTPTTPPTPPPSTPPSPPPVNPPQEPVMQLPAQVADVITRYTAAIPVPRGGGPGTADWDATTNGASGVFEDKCRVWVRGLGEQVCFETGDVRWGVKNAGGGRPQSKDSITFNSDHLYNFDVLSGVGTGQPKLVVPATADVIDGQTFMPVSPVNHLGAAPPVTTPPPTPPVDPNAADLSARVGALEAALAHILASQETLEGRIDALPAPTPLPDLSTIAYKGDKVTVSAKLPFVGSVVAHGTIDT